MLIPAGDTSLFCTVRGAGPHCLVLSAIGTRPYERMTPAPLTDHLTLIHVDVRGSGRSTGRAADLDFDVLASDLEAVRAALGIEHVAVLGHSILGILALEYARRRPERVSHAILVGTPPRGDMGWLAAEASRYFEEHAPEERKAVLRRNLADLPPGATPGQAMLARTPQRFFDPTFDAAPLFAESEFRPELMGHVMGTLTPEWDVVHDADTLRVPVLIALGRHDYTVPCTVWDEAAARLPKATVRIFERSGHQPFFEEPERFAAAVVEWMGRRGLEPA
jgi:proline iminopeptidase